MSDRNGKAKLVGLVGVGCCALLMASVPGHEGTVLKTYRDPIGILTSCTGHTGPELAMGQLFTTEECQEVLAGDLTTAAEGVAACVDAPLTDTERAAWISFTFNVGVKAFCKSTAAKLLAYGRHLAACAELSKWTMAGGKVLPGLVRRRAAERQLCEQGLTA